MNLAFGEGQRVRCYSSVIGRWSAVPATRSTAEGNSVRKFGTHLARTIAYEMERVTHEKFTQIGAKFRKLPSSGCFRKFIGQLTPIVPASFIKPQIYAVCNGSFLDVSSAENTCHLVY